MSRERGDSCSLARALTAGNPKTPMRGGPVSPRLPKPRFKPRSVKTSPSMSIHGVVQGEAPSFLGLKLPPMGRKGVGRQQQLTGEMTPKFLSPCTDLSEPVGLDTSLQAFSATALSSPSPLLSFPLLQSLPSLSNPSSSSFLINPSLPRISLSTDHLRLPALPVPAPPSFSAIVLWLPLRSLYFPRIQCSPSSSGSTGLHPVLLSLSRGNDGAYMS